MKFTEIHHQSLPSTNEYAVSLIMEGKANEGMVIVTDHQTHGKGNGDHQWESEKEKNITMSLILKPHLLEASDQFFLTEITSLALYDVIKKHLSDENIHIKWPNDLYCGQKKISGVLIQNFLKGNYINHSVIGIGLNVNQKKFLSNAPNPVSMSQISHKNYNLKVIKHDILLSLAYYYQQINAQLSRTELNNQYINHLYLYEKMAIYKDGEGIFKGKIKGINHFGQLIIEDEKRTIRLYNFKEVEFIIE